MRRGVMCGPDGIERERTIITVTCSELPDPTNNSMDTRARVAVMNAFIHRFPELFEERYRSRYERNPEKYGRFNWSDVCIELQPGHGMKVEGVAFDSMPLMAIASGVSPDIIYVNFRQSDTYIQEGFLYPLDKPEDRYYTSLSQEERDFIYNPKVMPVVQRQGPGGTHVWTVPQGGVQGKVFLYRKDLLARYGLPEPANDWTWEDFYTYCRKLTNPHDGTYGVIMTKKKEESWFWMTFLWSMGGEVMDYDAQQDEWRACFDSDEAAMALDFYIRLVSEHWMDDNGKDRYGYITYDAGDFQKWEHGKIGFWPAYIGERLFVNVNPELVGIVAVPRGFPDRNGVRHRGGELNARMQGIFSGCTNPVVRDAAWEYLRFCESPEAVKIYTGTMVESGLGRFVNPDCLSRFGYGDLVRLVPPRWLETYRLAIETGKPEPYGRNCQMIYHQMTKPIWIASTMALKGQLPLNNRGEMERAVKGSNPRISQETLHRRRQLLKSILKESVHETNEKMIGRLEPQELHKRRMVAITLMIAMTTAYVLMFYHLKNVFMPPKAQGLNSPRWGFGKYRTAYLLLLPAVLAIFIWRYVPLIIGTMIALQDYKIIAPSEWVWLDNFANVLWDPEWWEAIWNSVRYCFLVISLTFLPPVILAVILQEIPVGRVFFRTVFFFPAVITGLVVVYLWRSFYDKDENGTLNAIMLNLPAFIYVGLAMLLFFVMLVFARRLFIHGNLLVSMASLVAGGILFCFFIRFAWPILKTAELDPSREALHHWVVAFYCLLGGVGVILLAFAVKSCLCHEPAMALMSLLILVILAILVAVPYVLTRDAYAPLQIFLRLFHCMKNPYMWLENPDTAMLCCVLPMVWAGMGPGCLIYLAALKGVPEDYYEAAEIDGATFVDKILFVIIPLLRPLLIIQFMGIFIGSWASSSYILAMTGGSNKTNVAELHIFYKAYLFLKIGPATAMAWMLGLLLIVFTVYQLRILSRLEFHATVTKK